MGGKDKDKGKGPSPWKILGTIVLCGALGFAGLYLFVPSFRSTIDLWAGVGGGGGGGGGDGGTGTYSGEVTTPLTPTVTHSPLDFDCVLHQHKAGFSYTSASSWVTNALVDDVSDLNAAVFQAARLAGYDDFWVSINGTVENNAYTFNDDYGPRTYYARDFHIDEDGANEFEMYATPSAGAGFTIRNLATGAAITTANITYGTNFSITQFLNNGSVGAFDQKYVGFTNYLGQDVDVNLLMTFTNKTGGVGASMETSDLVASNLSATGGSASAVIDYHLASLGQTPVTTNFIWSSDAITDATAIIVSPNSVGIVQRWLTTPI